MTSHFSQSSDPFSQRNDFVVNSLKKMSFALTHQNAGIPKEVFAGLGSAGWDGERPGGSTEMESVT